MTSRTGTRPRRILTPRIEALEPRQVPTTTSSAAAYADAQAKYAYDRYVSELQRIELASVATPAQYLALRDDARAISGAASASGPAAHAPSAPGRLADATLLIDRSLIEGWQGAPGFAVIRVKLGSDLAPFGVAPALLDKTVADMRGAATSAAVDAGEFQQLGSDISAAQGARDRLVGGHPGVSFRDPQVYYTQHLRGFFRGFAQDRAAAEAALQADLARISPGPGGVVGRDVGLLEQLGAPITSASNGSLTDAYAAAFSGGTPDSAGLAAFRSAAISALDGTGNARRVASVDRLIADAPAFSRAAGTPANVNTLVADVRTLTDDGEGASLNPFLIAIVPGVARAG